MARIRTIKPEFFRHELLQDLEAANQGQYIMLVFAGLFGHCDKEGRFEWKPRTLKLDILPFLDFDLGASLMLLSEARLVVQYESGGKTYGYIPTFKDHQRISGKEAQEEAKHPQPPKNVEQLSVETTVNQSGSNREAVEITGREGKGREEEGNGAACEMGDFEKIFAHGVALLRDLEIKDTSYIHQWLNSGCDVDKDIIPTITRLARHNPSSWMYFTTAIMNAKATRERPLPTGSPQAFRKPAAPKMKNVTTVF
jgi:hypothetical protein